jgi:hypothetical protein
MDVNLKTQGYSEDNEMKTLLAFLVISAATVGFISRHRLQVTAGGQLNAESVREVERKWTKAFLTGDTVYLDQLLEPDYESVSFTGEIRSRQDIINKARAHRDNPVPIPELKESIIQIHGNAAISRVDQEIVDPATQRTQTVRFLDVMVFYDGRWHVLYTQGVALSAK